MPDAGTFFSPEEEKLIVETIKLAEQNTSGEIRVHLDNSLIDNEWEKAQRVFLDLRMNETALRNGVLFHISVKQNTFSIVADEGINNAVPDDFWDDIKDQMQQDFQNKKMCIGLCRGIASAGKALKEYFPFQNNDENELPDEISK